MSDRISRPDHPLLAFLPEAVIQLNIEVQKHHPQLFLKHIDLRTSGMVEMLTILATEVNILVDGTFTEEGIEALAEQIRQRLVARRTVQVSPLILPPGFKK